MTYKLKMADYATLNPYDGTISARIRLRGLNAQGDYDPTCIAVTLFVYASKEAVMIDLRVSDVYSATLHEMEGMTKTLKRLLKKPYPWGDFHRNSSVHEQVTLAVVALGITESINHDDLCKPVGLYIKKLADSMTEQLA